MSTEPKTCATCAHARKVAAPMAVRSVLVCHGAPPTTIVSSTNPPYGAPATLISAWPPVDPTGYCGMWQSKPPAIVTTNSGENAA